jgi:hypothetical protein
MLRKKLSGYEGPQAPPTRKTYWAPTTRKLTVPTRKADRASPPWEITWASADPNVLPGQRPENCTRAARARIPAASRLPEIGTARSKPWTGSQSRELIPGPGPEQLLQSRGAAGRPRPGLLTYELRRRRRSRRRRAACRLRLLPHPWPRLPGRASALLRPGPWLL